jgi:hypothetical protein
LRLGKNTVGLEEMSWHAKQLILAQNRASAAGLAGPLNAPYQMKVVAVAVTAVAGLVDERTDDIDAETSNAALFCGILQIRPAESERIKRLAIVHEADPQAVPSEPERYGDGSPRGMWPTTMRYGVGEELIENDQKPRPLVIRQTTLMRELDSKGLQPSELGGLGA